MGFLIVVMWSVSLVSLMSLFFLFAEGDFLFIVEINPCGREKGDRKRVREEIRVSQRVGYELLTFSIVSPFFVLFLRRHLIPQALQSDPLPGVDVSEWNGGWGVMVMSALQRGVCVRVIRDEDVYRKGRSNTLHTSRTTPPGGCVARSTELAYADLWLYVMGSCWLVQLRYVVFVFKVLTILALSGDQQGIHHSCSVVFDTITSSNNK